MGCFTATAAAHHEVEVVVGECLGTRGYRGVKFIGCRAVPNALPCAGPARSPGRPRHNSRSDQ